MASNRLNAENAEPQRTQRKRDEMKKYGCPYNALLITHYSPYRSADSASLRTLRLKTLIWECRLIETQAEKKQLTLFVYRLVF
ncbi:MAG: hypothetical protein CUN53_15380 [Phototrophicales bacterium]|nr:MAG: hypothetical protein CUN53_15380 [Phototrophicales bacterium]